MLSELIQFALSGGLYGVLHTVTRLWESRRGGSAPVRVHVELRRGEGFSMDVQGRGMNEVYRVIREEMPELFAASGIEGKRGDVVEIKEIEPEALDIHPTLAVKREKTGREALSPN
jgi:hypothetical protein